MSQILVTGEAKIRDIQGPVVANSGVITALDGAASQYVRGDGTLADFPTSSGGGSSVSYYLNSSVSQGTIGGVAYRELSKDPIIGAGTDIAISSNGYVANYITDVNDPDVTIVAGGNFNCEFYFSVNNNTGNPNTYAELYKYDGTTFTLLGSSVGVPEYINQGTIIAPYYFAIPVATAALALTDRLAIRIYVNVDGRTVTLHTENGHLCQVVTTLSKGMVSLNNLTDQSQYLATGTSGTNFNIVSSGDTHTFNLPVASATNTGKLSSTDWSTFNGKVPYTGATADVDLGAFTLSAGATSSNIVYANGSGSSSGMLYLKKGTIAANYTGYNGIYATSTSYGLIADTGSAYKLGLFSLASLTDNTARTFTLPDASGTLALTSNLSSYVPYTGATTNVTLGTNTLTAATLIVDQGTTGTTLRFKQYGSASYNTNGYTDIYAVSNNIVGFGLNQGSGNFKGFTFNVVNVTSNESRDLYIPDATGTIALLSGTQTFTGATTFSSDILVSGLRIGTGSGGSNNARFGQLSFMSNTTGGYNTAIGSLTLNLNTTGSNNTAVGNGSLQQNTTGDSNTAVGYNSLVNNTTGGSNTAIGYISLGANTTGVFNTALGSGTLASNTTGVSNTAIGANSLLVNTTGNNNTAIGTDSLNVNTTGSRNTAIGYYALNANTTANNNAAIGYYTLVNNTTGAENLGVGNEALRFNTVGNNNVGIGNQSLRLNTTGTSNTSIGVGALYSNTTGTNNIAIGYNSATSIETGSNNTIIGGYVGTAAMSNNIVLADGAGNIRYQWNGTNNVFGNPISGTSATFSGNVTLNSSSLLRLGNSDNASTMQIWNSQSGAANNLLVYDNAASAYRFVINSSGNVGIGTSSPFAIADVNLTVNGPTGAAIQLGYNGTRYGQFYVANDEVRLSAVANLPLTFYSNNLERMRITSGGGVGIGTTTVTGTTKLRVINSSASNGDALMFVDNAVYNGIGVYSAGADGYNGAATVMILGRNSSTTRSINAGGTINASGTDYAEYMTKAIEDNIAKGDIVGVDENGLLTNIFANAKSFVVKSTDPSYVGGDSWGNIDDIGKLSPEPTDEEKDEYNAKLEAARAKVDRIAFSGQVPCNVYDAQVGDYIIPIELNGKISGQAVSNPTFEQYQLSVGKVWKIMEDGRAWIAVKIG